MLLDIIIVVLVISAIYRGREIGFVQQLLSTIGFFGGLLLGALLEPHTISLVHTALNRSLITLITTLGMAFVFLGIGEYAGARLKQKIRLGRLNRVDNGLGAVLSALSILIAVWLSSSVIKSLPSPTFQDEIRDSRIISLLTRQLPSAPGVIASLGHLVDPNGFPQVFAGSEPNPPSHINLPAASQLAAAVNQDRASVVKVEGQGCGGIVEGSGFVVGDDLIATNAHVVAGIKKPYVIDANGTHSVTPIWFDANLDLAILRVSNLDGKPLILSANKVANGTPAAVMGYPGGGGFTANPASVLNEFTASGRNIYGNGNTKRDVYEIAATVIPGNSGGPLVTSNGTVVGVVFAESTSYNHVGYALAMDRVISAINQAEARASTVSTGNCAE